AGVPQLLMPMAHDQYDNAERLRRLDVARWLSPKHFRPAPVAQALDELIRSSHVAAQTHSIAERLKSADPLEDSCRFIEDGAGLRASLATD
ncbi:glycosyltransferase, partial [Singulisphaera rosea]